MAERVVHQCGCVRCKQEGDNGTKKLHAHLNQYLSTLTDQKRLELLAWESLSPSYGGDQELEKITGVQATVIAKMRWSIHLSLVANRPRFAPHVLSYPYGPLKSVVTYKPDEEQKDGKTRSNFKS